MGLSKPFWFLMAPYYPLLAFEAGVFEAGFKKDEPAFRTSMLVQAALPWTSWVYELSMDMFCSCYSSVDILNNGGYI